MKLNVLASLALSLLASTAALASPVVEVNHPVIAAPDRLVTWDTGGMPSDVGLKVSGTYYGSFSSSSPFFGPWIAQIPEVSGDAAYFMHDVRTPYTPVTIKSAVDEDFFALQFGAISGYGGPLYAHWEAFLDGHDVANGSVGMYGPTMFFSLQGVRFDEFRIGTYYVPFNTFDREFRNGNAIALDNIGVQLAHRVPEPGVLLLAGTGLLVAIGLRRRHKA